MKVSFSVLSSRVRLSLHNIPDLCEHLYLICDLCVCFRFTRSFSFSVAVGVFVGLVGVCVDVTEAKRSASAGHLQCAAAGLLCGAAAYADTPGSF